MGNESSSMNGNGTGGMDDLQKQILENQLEIQRIQIQNLQTNSNNQTNNQSFNLSQIFNNPQVQQQIASNPQKKLELLYKVLQTYNHLLSTEQTIKINQIIQETKQEIYQSHNSLQPPIQQSQQSQFLATNIGTQKQNRTKTEIAQSRRQTSMNVEQLSKNFTSEDDEEEARYRVEEQRRRDAFYERQRQRKFEYESKLKQLDSDKINSLRLFQLNENYTLDDLKTAYRKLALRTHPDRPNGNKEKFQVVTTCYFALIEKLKLRQKEASFDRMRHDSRDYFKEQTELSQKYNNKKSNSDNPLFNKNDKKFNGKMFNKIFDENKLYDSNEEGYDDWLKNDDAVVQPKVFSDKFNIDVFNNTFGDSKDTSSSQEIIEYKEPQALVSCNNIQYTDIDQSGKKNYTKASDNSNDLGYSDLKSAYTKTNNLINPNNVNVKQYRNVDELEQDRSNISFEQTPEQIRQNAILKQIEQEEEFQRKQRIQQRDNITETHYKQIHQQMIGDSS
jgi:curved DNA-binding protein CbpA